MEKKKEDGNELSPFQPIKLLPLDARITDTNFAPITWVSIKDIKEEE